MADRNSILKGIIGAMKSVSAIQQEQNKLKMNLLENSEKFQNSFFETMMKNKMEQQSKQESLPFELEKRRQEQEVDWQQKKREREYEIESARKLAGDMGIGGIAKPAITTESPSAVSAGDGIGQGYGVGEEAPPSKPPEFIMNPSFIATGKGDVFIKNPAAASARQIETAKTKLQMVEDINKRKEIGKVRRKSEDIMGEIGVIKGDVNDLFNVYKQIPRGSRGPFQQTVGATQKFLQTGTGEKIKEYTDSVDFFLSNISRRLGGERGVLTDRDIERVKKMFPTLQDEDNVATAKMGRIEDFITRRIQESKSRMTKQVSDIEKGGSTEPIHYGRFIVEEVPEESYAEGGIVDRPQMAMVGEKGREFIIPEKNVSPQTASQLEQLATKQYTAVNPKTGQRILWRNNKWVHLA